MRRVLSIVRKDLAQIARNRFLAAISVLVIVVFGVLFHLLPSRVDETFKMGFYLEVDEEAGRAFGLEGGREEIASRLEEAGGEKASEGLELGWADSEDELMRMVEGGRVSAGISLRITGEEPRVALYVSSDAPAEISGAGEAIAEEIGYKLVGYRLPADFKVSVLGPDFAGRQIPMRDRLRAALLTFVFLLEIYSLGNLVMEETQKKTAQAVLVTPVTLGGFISAKATTGIVFTFGQGLLLALLLRALPGDTWAAVLVFLFMGAAMMVGLSFIIGAASKDFISMAMISLIPMVVLAIPGFLAVFPGFDSPVVKAIPTYWLVKPFDGMLNYGMEFSTYLSSLAWLALFTAGFFAVGYVVLRRRLA